MKPTLLIALALLAAPLAGCASSDPAPGEGQGDCEFPASYETDNPVVELCTNHGGIGIELFANLTPQTAQHIGNLSQAGFYDDVKFHRVIDGFVIQGGDPNTKQPETSSNRYGTGGPGYTIIDEFPCKDGNISHEHTGQRSSREPCDDHGGLVVSHDSAGMVSMANTGEPKTGGSQFFITLAATSNLDGTHAVFGQVVHGMGVVEEIGKVPTDCTQQGYQPGSGQGGCRDRPVDPVVIQTAEVVGELPGVEVEKFHR